MEYDKNIGAKIKSALGWNTGVQLFSQIVTFTMSVFLARILDPEDFGIMAIGLILVNYANTFTEFGFNNALIQNNTVDEEHFNSVFSINIFISILLTVLCFFSAPFMADLFKSKEAEAVIKVLASIFILTSFSSMYATRLKKALSYKYLSITNLINSLLKYIIGLALAVAGFKYWSLVISEISALVVTTYLYYWNSKWIPRLSYNHAKMKDIYNFGVWNFIRAQSYFVTRYFMKAVIGSMLNPVSLGYFDKALSISQRPATMFGKKINGVMFSGFSSMQDNPKQLNNWFLNLVLIQIIFLLPLFLGLFVITPHLIPLLLGEKWIPAIEPFRILCLSQFLSSCNGGYASFNIGTGKYKAHTIRICIGTILYIAISVVFTYFGGLNGACWAMLLMNIVFIVLTLDLVYKKIDMHIIDNIKVLLPYVLCNVLMFGGTIYISNLYSAISLISMTVIACSGCFIYVLAIIIVNFCSRKHLFYPLKVSK